MAQVDISFLPDKPKTKDLDFLPDKPQDNLSFLPDQPKEIPTIQTLTPEKEAVSRGLTTQEKELLDLSKEKRLRKEFPGDYYGPSKRGRVGAFMEGVLPTEGYEAEMTRKIYPGARMTGKIAQLAGLSYVTGGIAPAIETALWRTPVTLYPKLIPFMAHAVQRGATWGLGGVVDVINKTPSKETLTHPLGETAFGVLIGGVHGLPTAPLRIAGGALARGGWTAAKKLLDNKIMDKSDLIDIGLNAALGATFEAINAPIVTRRYKQAQMDRFLRNKVITKIMRTKGIPRAEAEKVSNLINQWDAVNQNPAIILASEKIPINLSKFSQNTQIQYVDVIAKNLQKGLSVSESLGKAAEWLGKNIPNVLFSDSVVKDIQKEAKLEKPVETPISPLKSPITAPKAVEGIPSKGGEILSQEDIDLVQGMRSEIEGAEAGKRIKTETGEWIAQGSTFPEWFRQSWKGLTKKKALDIIKKKEAGEILTEKQELTFNNMLGGYKDAERIQVEREARTQEGIPESEIEEALRAGEADGIQIEQSEPTSTGKPPEWVTEKQPGEILKGQAKMPPKTLRPKEEQVEQGDLIKELEARPKEKEIELFPKGGAAGATVAAQAQKGYGIIEPSEKSAKVKPVITDYSKVSENIPPPEKTNYIKESLKITSPASVSETAQITAQIMRKGLAELAHKDVMSMEALKKAHSAFSWMSKKDSFAFIDKVEEGLPQEKPKLQPFADTMRKLLDERKVIVQNLGKGYLESFYTNYFPHIWKDPNRAKNVIASIMGRKRLEGTKAFLKKRTLVSVKEGLEKGLEPVSDNPVDLVLLKLHEIDRYVMAQEIIKDLKEKGLAKFVYSRSRAPEGYRQINDNAFTVYMPPEITKKEAFDSVIVDQLMDIAKSLGIDTKRFMAIGGKRWGYAVNTPEGTVRTRFASPESVLAHEIGHVLGYKFQLYNMFRKYKETYEHTFVKGKRAGETITKPTKEAIEWRKTIDEQWRKIADARYKGLDTTQGYKDYVRKSKEKEAVLLEALIHAPEEFKSLAPDIYDLFTKFLNQHGQLRPLLDVKPSLVLGEAQGKIKIPGFTVLGHYYAPKDAALIINNHLSPGLRNNENKLISSSYNLLRGAGNVLNQANLSLSLFHALNVSTDMMASTIGLGLRQATMKGQMLKGIANLATYPFAPVVSMWNGAKIRKAYRQQMDSIKDPKLKSKIEALVMAGGRDRIDVFYYNQQIKALQKTFKDILKGSGVEKLTATARLPFNIFGSTLEVLAKPLMEWYVPTGKLGLFSKLAQSEMERAEKGQITDEQLTYMLTKIWDSVDNRMGQLIYDNLFWNKVLKDSLLFTFRSTGWNLGSIREFGGIPLDLMTAGERIKRGDVFISHKMGYGIGAAVVYSILGAMITYLMTGERPKDIKDYFFPRTGVKNPDGSDERLSLPTYAKDIYAYITRPLETLRSKRHPLIGLFVDQFTNKDFFNVQVSDFKDPLLKQVYDRVVHIKNYAKPFSFKNYERMQKSTDDPLHNAFVSVLGIISAPSYISRSNAQKLMYRYLSERMPDVSRTKEDFAKSEYRRTLINRIRKGENVDRREARQTLGERSYNLLFKNASLDPFESTFKRLTIQEALNVYSIATDEERKKVREVFGQKYENYMKSKGRTEETEEIRNLFWELWK